MSIEIATISIPPLELGEGPHWDNDTKALYFVDIFASTIHKYSPSLDQHTFTRIVNSDLGERSISFIIPVKGKTDEFVISYGNDIALIKWDGLNEISDFKILIKTERSKETRINDGKASPSGLLFAGSMEIEKTSKHMLDNIGSFYAFVDQKPKVLLKNIGISNGLAWSLDEKVFYYIDSMIRKVNAFDYDAKNVEITNQRTIFDFEQNNIDGLPDGMTIDTDENLWIACFQGSRVIKINPKTGKLLTFIQLPCSKITSVAFGGENLEDLYVTSAYIYTPIFEKEEISNPNAGCLFKITGTGSKGIAGVSLII